MPTCHHVGIFGMAGFIGGFGLIAAGGIGASGFLARSTLSLTSYVVCLVVDHLGDPLEFRRRYPSQEEWKAAHTDIALELPPLGKPPRAPQPVSRHEERTTLRSVRTTVGHA